MQHMRTGIYYLILISLLSVMASIYAVAIMHVVRVHRMMSHGVDPSSNMIWLAMGLLSITMVSMMLETIARTKLLGVRKLTEASLVVVSLIIERTESTAPRLSEISIRAIPDLAALASQGYAPRIIPRPYGSKWTSLDRGKFPVIAKDLDNLGLMSRHHNHDAMAIASVIKPYLKR